MRYALVLTCLFSVACSRSTTAAPAGAEEPTHASASTTAGSDDSDDGPNILVAFPTCRRDYAAMCEEHEANARVIECLRAHEADLRSSCRAALNPGETPLPPPSAPSGGGGHGGGGGGHSH